MRSFEIAGKTITLDDVSWVRQGDSFAVVIDTVLCQSAIDIARNATLLVPESTYLEEHTELARLHHHLTRISHKILKKSDEMLCEMHRECARDHYQVHKARAIRDEDRMTSFDFFESL